MIGRVESFYNVNMPYSSSEDISKEISADSLDVDKISNVEDVGKVFDNEKADEVKGECQTCKNRKYLDGSDEMVSFKSAAHISPEAAGARVRGHEGEHVSNAYKKAFQDGGKVVNASVSIHTAVCPECGRTYVSGGTTNTVISTPINQDKKNPYVQNKGAISDINSVGLTMDFGI